MRNNTSIAFWLAMASMLGGCDRSSHEDSARVAEPAHPAESAVDTSEPVGDAHAEPVALTIQVFREESATGVAAEIERLDDTNTGHHVASVGDSGVARLTQPCNDGERFAAKPMIAAFLRVAPEKCAKTITFRLHSAPATYALMRAGDDAVKTGDLLVAQANYGLAAERLRYAKPEEADRLEALATAAAGRILGVATPTITQGGKEVVSGEMAEKLRTFQRGAQLPESAVLDAATREAISKMPRAQVLQRALETSATVASPNVPPQTAVRAEEVRAVVLSPAARARATAVQRSIDRAAVQQER
jgi:hypothetical protein